MHGSRQLQPGLSLGASGVTGGATLRLTSRLRGGKPVKVKMMTGHLPCGPEVIIDLEATATKDDIKAKLEAATGVPAAQQKVMLSGINQIVMGDKRCVLVAGAPEKEGLCNGSRPPPPALQRVLPPLRCPAAG